MEHIHLKTRPKWLENQHDCSNSLGIWPHSLSRNMLVESQTTSNTVTYGGPSLQNFPLLGLPLVLNSRIFLPPHFKISLYLALSLTISASYLDSFLEAWKPSRSDVSSLNPSRDIITISAPDPLTLDSPSINTHHGCTEAWHTPTVTPGAGVNSATKSANT